VAGQLAGLQAECRQLAELAAVFEFPALVEPAARGVRELLEALVAAKDVWDCGQLCELQFAVRRPPGSCRGSCWRMPARAPLLLPRGGCVHGAARHRGRRCVLHH
jgi:hypothetical protein